MNNSNSSLDLLLIQKSTKSNQNRQDFWNGTLIDNYNFLMSEELIYHCKNSLGETFSSLNDLTVHHVSYNEFEKQYVELIEWCAKNSKLIEKISSNILTCYLRQSSYEDLYDQGLMRLRMFNQYSNKLIERFPDLKFVINNKIENIYRLWNELEGKFLNYLDEDFDRIVQDLYNELFLFEEWIIDIEEQLEKFYLILNEKIFLEDFQRLIKLQNEIKSKNSSVSSSLEICERLKIDYQQYIEQIPLDYAIDLENRWHQIWIHSVEIQCKFEEKLKRCETSTSICLTDDDDDDDIIPFNSSEYEKISITSSKSTELHKVSSKENFNLHHHQRRMSLNILPKLSPSIYYYSLTNINDNDNNNNNSRKRQVKRTSSKLDIGYASEDDFDKKAIYTIKKSQSDYTICLKSLSNISSSLTHSLPILEYNQMLPEWWRHSYTSAYDTCSNPDIDLSIEETKKCSILKPSLLIYNKKYTNKKSKSPLISNSYDASAEYTDPEQSENDIDISSSSPIYYYHQQQNSESLFYNRYTTITDFSSNIGIEIPSEIDNQQLTYLGEVSPMNIDRLDLPSSNTPLNSVTINDKIDSSEPCWDGYQNPLFYPLNQLDIDSVETTLKWDDQFFEMDQLHNSTSDDEIHVHDKFHRFLRNNNGSSLSLITSVLNKHDIDSDSDLDDFNYVINETERQLLKTRQSLEKKKRQQFPYTLNDRNQKKYDEILRTCQTNIQCLEQILKNLPQSKNFHINNTRAIELLQSYLSDWHEMQDQANSDRIRARHYLHLCQEIINLKIHLDDVVSHINTNFNQSNFENHTLNQLKTQIYNEFELDKQNRQKLNSFSNDIQQAEEHLKEYYTAYPDGPSSFNINEHLYSSHRILDQFTTKMDSYQIQLRTLLTMIDNLLLIENHIEQKLTSIDYPIDFQELQMLIDNYEQMIPRNHFYNLITNYCEYRLEVYKKMFNELIRKQDKHVSFDGSSNFNNNNSTTINSSTSSSSNASTPQQKENFRMNKNFFNKSRQTEIQDVQQTYATSGPSTNKQTTTSSYISDDYKVLYIETVIEVDKPVFYERTTDTLSTTNTEYHHHHHRHIPHSTQSTSISNRNTYLMADDNNTITNHSEDSTDDDLNDIPVAPSTSTISSHHSNNSRQEGDSGVELADTSSSTLSKQQENKGRNLFPPADKNPQQITSEPTLLRRIQKQKKLNNEAIQINQNHLSQTYIHLNQTDTYWNRFRQSWLRSLLIGLLILLILFTIYLSSLDTCSRSTVVRSITRKIISIENNGLPTI